MRGFIVIFFYTLFRVNILFGGFFFFFDFCVCSDWRLRVIP